MSARSSPAVPSPAPEGIDSGPVTPEGSPPPEAKQKSKRLRISLEVEVPKYELVDTPSVLDGLAAETENDFRVWGCQIIQDTGILLKQPQVVMACAQILFQRFYYRKSMVTFDVKPTAIACLFLAAKVEESPKGLRHTIHTAHHVVQKTDKFEAKFADLSQLSSNAYSKLKNEVIKSERRILKELGFCVHLKHPHKLIISYLKLIGMDDNKELAQVAWNYMNDGLRTSAFCRFRTEVIACACLHLGSLKLRIPVPDWWEAFKVSTQDLECCCTTMLALYARPKRPFAEMDAEIQKLQDKKLGINQSPKALIKVSSPRSSVASSRGTTPGSTVDKSKHSSPVVPVPLERRVSPLVPRPSSNPGPAVGSSLGPSRGSDQTKGVDRDRDRDRSRDRSRDREKDRSRDRDRDRDRRRSRSRSRSPPSRRRKGRGHDRRGSRDDRGDHDRDRRDRRR